MYNQDEKPRRERGGRDKLYKGKIYKLEGTLQKVQSEWTE